MKRVRTMLAASPLGAWSALTGAALVLVFTTSCYSPSLQLTPSCAERGFERDETTGGCVYAGGPVGDLLVDPQNFPNSYTCHCECRRASGGGPTTELDLAVCMTPEDNPNVAPGLGVVPSDTDLTADCTQRVENTLEGMIDQCNYPKECLCSLGGLEGGPRFDASCNDGCEEEILVADCSNFDPENVKTATNAAGDEPVCLVAGADPPVPTADPLAAGLFGKQTLCEVGGDVDVKLADEPAKTTFTRGLLHIVREPCGDGQTCAGIAYALDMDPITFEVRFASDPRFEDLKVSGASVPNGAVLNDVSGGFGVLEGYFAPGTALSSGRGRRSDTVRAFLGPNSEKLRLFMTPPDWPGIPGPRRCGFDGSFLGQVRDEDPENGDAVLEMSGSLLGDILNYPPTANAGPDQTVECTSALTPISLRGTSSDLDANVVDVMWLRGGRAGDPMAAQDATTANQASRTTEDYIFRVIDAYGQADEDTATVAVVDTTPAAISCNAPLAITPPRVPVSFTATAEDTCEGIVTPEITRFTCFAVSKTGKVAAQGQSCDATIVASGPTITIGNSHGVGEQIRWTVAVSDGAGNAAQKECRVNVLNPSKGA